MFTLKEHRLCFESAGRAAARAKEKARRTATTKKQTTGGGRTKVTGSNRVTKKSPTVVAQQNQNPNNINFSTQREQPSAPQPSDSQRFVTNSQRLQELQNIQQSRQLRGDEGSEFHRLMAEQSILEKKLPNAGIVRSEAELNNVAQFFDPAQVEKARQQLRSGAVGVNIGGFSPLDTGQAGFIGRETLQPLQSTSSRARTNQFQEIPVRRGAFTPEQNALAQQRLAQAGFNLNDERTQLAYSLVSRGISVDQLEAGGSRGPSGGQEFVRVGGEDVIIPGGTKGFDDLLKEVEESVSGKSQKEQIQRETEQQRQQELDQKEAGKGEQFTTSQQTSLTGDPELDALIDPTGNISRMRAEQASISGDGIADARESRNFMRSILQNERQDILDTKNEQLNLADDISDLARNRQMEEKRKLLADNAREQEMFQIDAKREIAKQREQNIVKEQQNRRVAAKFGINYDTGGLEWMQRESRLSSEFLTSMIEKAAVGDRAFSDQRMSIINTYMNNMDAIDLNARNDYAKAHSDYKSEKARINKEFFANEKEFKAEQSKIRQQRFDNISKIDFFVAEQYASERVRTKNENIRMEQEKQKKEEEAIDMIEFLSKNYNPEDVEGAINELAKNITSFDASDLAGKPFGTATERKKKSSGGISNGFGGILPVPEPQKTMSFDDFVNDKVLEIEEEKGMSLNESKRQELRDANNEIWKKQYESTISPSIDSLPSSGNLNVDAAAKDVLNGVFGGVDPIERAAETWNVSRGAVAQQMQVYQRSGYVPDFPQFTDKQVERYEPFIKRIRNTDEYKSAANASFIVRRIEAALSLKTGQGDSTAIELLQRGIKDPGMAVRNDDIERITSAVPYLDKFNPELMLQKVREGTLFSDYARQQFRDVLMRVGQETISAYNEEKLPSVREEAKRLGLPESAFRNVDDLYDGADPLSVSRNVQSVINSYGYGSSPTEE